MGVATQDERLRKHFRGDYHYVINYFTFLAQHVREYLAEMGFTSLNDIVGHTELLTKRDTSKIWAPVLPKTQAKWESLDFSRLEKKETGDVSLYCTKTQDHELNNLLDQQIIASSGRSLFRTRKR